MEHVPWQQIANTCGAVGGIFGVIFAWLSRKGFLLWFAEKSTLIIQIQTLEARLVSEMRLRAAADTMASSWKGVVDAGVASREELAVLARHVAMLDHRVKIASVFIRDLMAYNTACEVALHRGGLPLPGPRPVMPIELTEESVP